MDKIPNLFAALIVPYNDFARAPIYVFGKHLEEICTALKVATGYQYDNRHVRVSRGLHEFAFSLTQQTAALGSERYKELLRLVGPSAHVGPGGGNVFTLRIWDFSGTEALCGATFACEPGSSLPQPIMAKALKAMDEYAAGIRHCSDCGADVPRSSNNRYFAGAYCEPCWAGDAGTHRGKGGWKAVEARETYD